MMRPKQISKEVPMRNYFEKILFWILAMLPGVALASVESTLSAAQGKLTNVILPACSVIGIVWAAVSFMSGNEKARTHIWYALIGTAVGFGAQAIVNFISQTVN